MGQRNSAKCATTGLVCMLLLSNPFFRSLHFHPVSHTLHIGSWVVCQICTSNLWGVNLFHFLQLILADLAKESRSQSMMTLWLKGEHLTTCLSNLSPVAYPYLVLFDQKKEERNYSLHTRVTSTLAVNWSKRGWNELNGGLSLSLPNPNSGKKASFGEVSSKLRLSTKSWLKVP